MNSQSGEVQLSNILLKISWSSNIKLLSSKDRSNLLINIFNYHTGDMLLPLSKTANIVFSNMVEVFEFNKLRYEKKVVANRENGKKGGRPTTNNQNNPNGYLTKPDNPIDREIDKNRANDRTTTNIKVTDPEFQIIYMKKFDSILNVKSNTLPDPEERRYVTYANILYKKLGRENFSKLIFCSEEEAGLISEFKLENLLHDINFIRVNMIYYLNKLAG